MPQPAGPRRPGDRLRRVLQDGLELPADIVFDLPRLTLLGALQLTVENHRGLLEFLPDRLAISTRAGTVVVEGQDLRVGVVRAGEIVVTGSLRLIRFETEARP